MIEALPLVFTSGWASGINAYAVVALLGQLGRFGGAVYPLPPGVRVRAGVGRYRYRSCLRASAVDRQSTQFAARPCLPHFGATRRATCRARSRDEGARPPLSPTASDE